MDGRSIGAFDPWMVTDYLDYRMPQRTSSVSKTLTSLARIDEDRDTRIAGVAQLRGLESRALGVRRGDPLPLLRVPLLVHDRN
jgi:hypothetical protein